MPGKTSLGALELSLLALLGWYLIMLALDDDVGASTAAFVPAVVA